MSTKVGEVAEVRWGYTMADLDRLARRVYNKTRRSYLFDQADHYSAAWFGITEHLFDAVEYPSERDLIDAGVERVGEESRANRQFYGINPEGEDGIGPRFGTYWRPQAARTDGFTDRIDDREALPRVLEVLNLDLYEAIVTLAAYGNVAEAAKALGLEYRLYYKRIERARAKLIAAWFAPEHPASLGNGYGDTCRRGHSRAQHSFRNERGANVCRICTRDTRRRAYYRNKGVEMPELEQTGDWDV